MGSGDQIKSAIKKYGIENFKKEILYTFNSEREMFEKEAEIVTEQFTKNPNTYNMKIGGLGGFTKQASINGAKKWHDTLKNHSQLKNEIYSKISKTMKQKIVSGEFTPVAAFTGKKHTKETKKKIGKANSIKQIGSNNSQYGTVWITNGIENKKIKKENLHQIPSDWKLGRTLT